MISHSRRSLISPYIAFADVFLNLALIFLLFIPIILIVSSRGWDNLRYMYFQQELRVAVRSEDPNVGDPFNLPRRDAPGEQRWTFQRLVFEFVRGRQASGLGSRLQLQLTPQSQYRLKAFAVVLTRHPNLWHRIRVEAHTALPAAIPNATQERQSVEISTQRAVAVHEFLFDQCHIQPNTIISSGRGYQDLFDPTRPTSPANDRVDILVTSPAVVTQQ